MDPTTYIYAAAAQLRADALAAEFRAALEFAEHTSQALAILE